MITKKSIQDAVKIFYSIQQSGNVFKMQIDNKTAELNFIYGYDDADISILSLILVDGDYIENIIYNPNDCQEIKKTTKCFLNI